MVLALGSVSQRYARSHEKRCGPSLPGAYRCVKWRMPELDQKNKGLARTVRHSCNSPDTSLFLLQPSAPPLLAALEASIFSSSSSLCSLPFSRISSYPADVLCRVMIKKLTKDMITNVVNPRRIWERDTIKQLHDVLNVNVSIFVFNEWLKISINLTWCKYSKWLTLANRSMAENILR